MRKIDNRNSFNMKKSNKYGKKRYKKRYKKIDLTVRKK